MGGGRSFDMKKGTIQRPLFGTWYILPGDWYQKNDKVNEHKITLCKLFEKFDGDI